MHKRAKELIKQLAAELEFETIPALDPERFYLSDNSAEILRRNYEAAKDLQHDLKTLYKILDGCYIE